MYFSSALSKRFLFTETTYPAKKRSVFLEKDRQKQVSRLKKRPDVSAFGAPLTGRTWSANSFRYGMNNKEKDDEIYGAGNFIDYGMRGYDTRLGRPPSVDPLFKQYPELSPYQFFSNNPIEAIDRDGEEELSNKLANEPSMEGKGLIIMENSARAFASAVTTVASAIGTPLINLGNRAVHGDLNEGPGRTTPLLPEQVFRLNENWKLEEVPGATGGESVTYEAGKEIMKATIKIIPLPMDKGKTLIDKIAVEAGKKLIKEGLTEGLDVLGPNKPKANGSKENGSNNGTIVQFPNTPGAVEWPKNSEGSKNSDGSDKKTKQPVGSKVKAEKSEPKAGKVESTTGG